MKINRADLIWNYAATFLRIAASVLLLPFILRMMSAEAVGIWSVFAAITSLIAVLDFGFNPSFTRNVTYVFSGVRFLKAEGLVNVDHEIGVDYGLLKGVITAMKWFYLRGALILLLLLGTLGTYYIYSLLQNYKGLHSEVYTAWALLCAINTYNLFSLYYDALLQGKGLIKRSKQIAIVGQLSYILITALLIMAGKGLIAVVAAQASSVIIIRWLSYHAFFTKDIKYQLKHAPSRSKKEIFQAIYPNAMKIGLTLLGSIMVQRSAIFIGSLYLSLQDIASYGISIQLISIIAGLSGIYAATYQPKIIQLRVALNNQKIKQLYLQGQIILLLTYATGGFGLLLIGKWVLQVIGSKTLLMPNIMLLIVIIISFLENNHSIAGVILLSDNKVPFFKASLIAGVSTIILLFVFFNFTNMGILAMILAPGIANLYNNWKWPYEVIRLLNISSQDIKNSLLNVTKIVK